MIEHPIAADCAAALRNAGHQLPLADGLEIGLVWSGSPNEFVALVRTLTLRGPAACIGEASTAAEFAVMLIEHRHATAVLLASPVEARLLESEASASGRGPPQST